MSLIFPLILKGRTYRQPEVVCFTCAQILGYGAKPHEGQGKERGYRAMSAAQYFVRTKYVSCTRHSRESVQRKGRMRIHATLFQAFSLAIRCVNYAIAEMRLERAFTPIAPLTRYSSSQAVLEPSEGFVSVFLSVHVADFKYSLIASVLRFTHTSNQSSLPLLLTTCKRSR